MSKKLTPAQRMEGIIIGIKTRNKQFCIRGHPLPKYRTNGRRNCQTCINIRVDPEKRAEYQMKSNIRKRAIRDSKFPMVTRLQVKGIAV